MRVGSRPVAPLQTSHDLAVFDTASYKPPNDYHEDGWEQKPLTWVSMVKAVVSKREMPADVLVEWIAAVGTSDDFEALLNNSMMNRSRVEKIFIKANEMENLKVVFGRIRPHNLSVEYTSHYITSMLRKAVNFVEKRDIDEARGAHLLMLLHLCFGKAVNGIEDWFDPERDGQRIPEIANALYQGIPVALVPAALENDIDSKLLLSIMH
jgi:hypothetical protein